MDGSLARFLWVCLGGAAGTGARWLLSGWLGRALGTAFPYGTLAVNVLGSFLLGAVMVVGTETQAVSETARLALTVGVLGGFTTYSTFNYETIEYARQGAWGLAAGNAAATFLSCLVAGLLGLAAGRALSGS
jgi:CrcB protein